MFSFTFVKAFEFFFFQKYFGSIVLRLWNQWNFLLNGIYFVQNIISIFLMPFNFFFVIFYLSFCQSFRVFLFVKDIIFGGVVLRLWNRSNFLLNNVYFIQNLISLFSNVNLLTYKFLISHFLKLSSVYFFSQRY